MIGWFEHAYLYYIYYYKEPKQLKHILPRLVYSPLSQTTPLRPTCKTKMFDRRPGELKTTLPLVQSIDVHAARSPLARPKHGQFGPAQAWHGPVQTVPGLARPAPRARAWAVTPAHGLARPGTELASRPGSGPLTPTSTAQPSNTPPLPSRVARRPRPSLLSRSAPASRSPPFL